MKLYANTALLRLEALGGDFSDKRASVYRHVLVTPVGVRYYVGQATDTNIRIRKQHQDPRWREKERSLHYDAWKTAEREFFVSLGTCPGKPYYLALNTFEMWGSLIFRSLPKSLLRRYLPLGLGVDDIPDIHLNLRSPLAQAGPGQKQELCRGFAFLKDHPDPVKREYHRRWLEGRIQELANLNTAHNDAARARAIEGGLMTVFTEKKKGRRTVTLQYMVVRVPPNVPEEEDSKVSVLFDLSPEGTQHPHVYATSGSHPSDPCRRLGIRMNGRTSQGVVVSEWARRTDGELAMKKANSVVDFLLNVPLSERRNRPRRYIAPNKTEGIPKPYYT